MDQRMSRYWAAHEKAFPKRGESNYTIPHEVLRDFLDAQWELRMRDQGKWPPALPVTNEWKRERKAISHSGLRAIPTRLVERRHNINAQMEVKWKLSTQYIDARL